jgi:serine/threonine protein kinase
MTSDADFDVLRQAGVSESGIDFVSQLLNRDPFSRPTEKECFQHPWIAEVADVDVYEDDEELLSGHSDHNDGLSVIGEDPEDELDASQLSIADVPGYTHGADGEGRGSMEAVAKRPRLGYIPTDVRYPSLPNIESFQDGQAVVDNNAKRLFGEVSSSALRSSHALGNVDAYDFDQYQPEEFLSSGESMMSDDPNESIISLPAEPFGGTAPSLMGAEKLVGQLNMNSLHPMLHFKAGPVNPSSLRQTTPGPIKEPAMPASTTNRDSVPPTSSPKESLASSPQEPTPRANFSRRIDLALPETASEASSDSSAHSSHRSHAPRRLPQVSKSQYDLEFATTLDAETGQAILEQLRAEEADSSDPIVHQPNATAISSALFNPDFAKPPKRFGKLKSLPGSIFDLTLYLEERLTSWGRGPLATIKYASPNDTRIPAYALEVTFWAPGIEAKIATGEDWSTIPGVMAILSTKARLGIWVNDVLLRRSSTTQDGPEVLQFGKLYTGDIITVYQNKERTKFLKLQCEFTHGESAQARPDNEPGFMLRQALMAKPDGANRMPIRPSRKDRD